MLLLTPRPLDANVTLRTVFDRAPDGLPVGVWLRWPGRPVRLRARCSGRIRAIILGGDLGWLLRSCPAVAVQCASSVVIRPSEDLIRARALRIVVSLQDRSPEEVLAACARARLLVRRSRVVYGRLAEGPHGG